MSYHFLQESSEVPSPRVWRHHHDTQHHVSLTPMIMNPPRDGVHLEANTNCIVLVITLWVWWKKIVSWSQSHINDVMWCHVTSDHLSSWFRTFFHIVSIQRRTSMYIYFENMNQVHVVYICTPISPRENLDISFQQIVLQDRKISNQFLVLDLILPRGDMRINFHCALWPLGMQLRRRVQ